MSLVLAALCLADVGTGIGWSVHVHRYQPVGQGNTADAPFGNAVRVTDALDDLTGVMLTGPGATQGGEAQSITNYGGHNVTILGSPRQSLLSMTWLPIDETRNSLTRMWKASHRFPMVLKPDEQIWVFISAYTPRSCRHEHGLTLSEALIDTEAYGIHHTYEFPAGDLTDDIGFVPIYVCPTQRERRAINRDSGGAS